MYQEDVGQIWVVAESLLHYDKRHTPYTTFNCTYIY